MLRHSTTLLRLKAQRCPLSHVVALFPSMPSIVGETNADPMASSRVAVWHSDALKTSVMSFLELSTVQAGMPTYGVLPSCSIVNFVGGGAGGVAGGAGGVAGEGDTGGDGRAGGDGGGGGD